MSTPNLVEGFTVTHRRYVSHSDAHYGDALAAGAYCLGLFGDVVTELAIRTDGDAGLLAGYSEVSMLAPVHAGDIIETTGTITRIGTRSRTVAFEARVVCRSNPRRGPSAADVLDPPLTVARATGTTVVPHGVT